MTNLLSTTKESLLQNNTYFTYIISLVNFDPQKEIVKKDRQIIFEMRDKWSKHKKWCVQARKDLTEGKKELIKNSGVFIKKTALNKVHATQ